MWLGVDPLADHPNQVDKSPYAAFWNNPIKYNDPDGRCPHCPIGFAIGFLADVAGQVIQNKLQGKDAFQDFSIGSALISGVSGMASGGITSIGKTIAIGTAESLASNYR